MHGMVMDETLHVFPCGRVGELLRVCLVRCRCRACVDAPLMVASLTRGSRKRCSVAWCAWLLVGHPSCCRRVSAGDQLTSVSLPVWRGHFLQWSQPSGVVWSHGQRVCSSGTWMCLRASHLATVVRNGNCSLRSSMRRFWRWAGTFAWRSAEWWRGICSLSWCSWMCARLSASPSTRERCWMGLG